MAPQPLSGVAFVLRDQRAVSALPHVADIISSFLVPTSSMSLAEACRFGSLKLLDHIWAASCSSIADRKPWWSLANFLRSDRHYHSWAFSMALEQAACRGDLEVVKWLFAHFPGCTAYLGVVEAAAEAGHLHILQFLHENSTAAFSDDIQIGQQQEMRAGLEYGNVITVNWGYDDMLLAAENGYLEIVRWLYEHTHLANVHRDVASGLRNALRFSDLPFAEWILERVPLRDENVIAQAVVQLAGSGHLQLFLPLYERLISGRSLMRGGAYYWTCALEAACGHGHLDVVEWLLGQWRDVKRSGMMTWRAFSKAGKGGHLEVVQLLATSIMKPPLNDAMVSAVSSGHLHVVRWLHSEMLECHDKGRLHQAHWLRNQNVGAKTDDDLRHSWASPDKLIEWMDEAAASGQLKILQFLDEASVSMGSRNLKGQQDEEAHQGRECESRIFERDMCSTNTATAVLEYGGHRTGLDGRMAGAVTERGRSIVAAHVALDKAAANGHLDVVQWMHAIGVNTCTTAAMDNAAMDHLEMVQWLHTNMQAECTSNAMDNAAASGRLEIVQWLHANRSEGCTTNAMDGAAASGHLEIVQWLHANRPEGCTRDAVEEAAYNGHTHVVRWLFTHPSIVVSDPSAWTGRLLHFDMLLFLHYHCPEVFSAEGVGASWEPAPTQVAEWLEEHYRGIQQ